VPERRSAGADRNAARVDLLGQLYLLRQLHLLPHALPQGLGISAPCLVDGRRRDALEQVADLPGQRFGPAKRVSVPERIAGDRRNEKPEKATSRNRRDVAKKIDAPVTPRRRAHAGCHDSIL